VIKPAFGEGGRRARLRDLGGQSEVRENLPDDGGVLERTFTRVGAADAEAKAGWF